MIKIKELCNDCSEQLQLAIEVLHIDLDLLTLSRLDGLTLQFVEVANSVRDIKGEVMETNEASEL